MDKQLKQRLLGAAVIVALAVIIVPELVKQPMAVDAPPIIDKAPPRPAALAPPPIATLQLPSELGEMRGPGGEAEPQPPAALNAPEEPAEPDESVEPPARAQAPESIELLPDEPQAAVAPLAGDALDEEAAEPQSRQSQTSPAAEERAVERRSAASEARRRTERERAAQAAERLAEREPIETAALAPIAVLQTRPAAATEKPSSSLPKLKLIARSQLQTASAETAPLVKTSPQTPSDGWMVQAGSFSIAQNANLLRDRLRAQSFSAALYPVRIDGRTVYRVRVGPHKSRAESERIRNRLLQEAGINGSVVPIYN